MSELKLRPPKEKTTQITHGRPDYSAAKRRKTGMWAPRLLNGKSRRARRLALRYSRRRRTDLGVGHYNCRNTGGMLGARGEECQMGRPRTWSRRRDL